MRFALLLLALAAPALASPARPSSTFGVDGRDRT
jgi:hypothetical protein